MKSPHLIAKPSPLLVLAGSAMAVLFSSSALSQSTCSSDGQAAHQALLERFISADCASCWRDPTPLETATDIVALDWIVPGAQGEEAPLSAAATRDALVRLEDQKLTVPGTQTSQERKVMGWPGAELRVVQGPAVNGYLGVIMSLKLPASALTTSPLQAWLVMVESLPQGLEESPVSRNLVRNVLQPSWNMRKTLEKSEQLEFYELRPMNIPAGALPERLRLVGWIQNAQGQILTTAATSCPAEEKPSH